MANKGYIKMHHTVCSRIKSKLHLCFAFVCLSCIVLGLTWRKGASINGRIIVVYPPTPHIDEQLSILKLIPQVYKLTSTKNCFLLKILIGHPPLPQPRNLSTLIKTFLKDLVLLVAEDLDEGARALPQDGTQRRPK